jgi:hypothetical protein
MPNQTPHKVIKFILKILLCGLSMVVGNMLGGWVSVALRIEQPKFPEPLDLRALGALGFAAAVILSVGLTTLCRWLRGSRSARFASIAWFVYAWLGINNTIEASVFTSIGGQVAMLVTMLFGSLSLAGAIVALFPGSGSGQAFGENLLAFFDNRTVAEWSLRLSAAVLIFPIVYFVFGTPVGLVVGKLYRAQSFGLRMPSSLTMLLGLQCARSLVSLSAALPLLVLWTGSRPRFAWTFGVVLFAASGLYGLLQALWMPWTLRGIHATELLLDSLSYGWVIALLLLMRSPDDTTRATLTTSDIPSVSGTAANCANSFAAARNGNASAGT